MRGLALLLVLPVWVAALPLLAPLGTGDMSVPALLSKAWYSSMPTRVVESE